MIGNYVALDVKTNLEQLGILTDTLKDGTHITIMYSPTSNQRPEYLEQLIKANSVYNLLTTFSLNVQGVSRLKFNNKHIVYLELDSNFVAFLHQLLTSLGCTHTYDNFLQHVSIGYFDSDAVADDFINKVTPHLADIKVKVCGVTSEDID